MPTNGFVIWWRYSDLCDAGFYMRMSSQGCGLQRRRGHALHEVAKSADDCKGKWGSNGAHPSAALAMPVVSTPSCRSSHRELSCRTNLQTWQIFCNLQHAVQPCRARDKVLMLACRMSGLSASARGRGAEPGTWRASAGGPCRCLSNTRLAACPLHQARSACYRRRRGAHALLALHQQHCCIDVADVLQQSSLGTCVCRDSEGMRASGCRQHRRCARCVSSLQTIDSRIR